MIYYTGDIHGSKFEIVRLCKRYNLTRDDIIVINEVLEGWGKDGTSFVQKHIPLKLIEDGYFETEEPTEGLTMQL